MGHIILVCSYTKGGKFMDYKEVAQYIKPYGEKPIIQQNYSIARVRKRFKEIYDLDIRKVTGYKFYRYRRFIEYNVYNSDGECILQHVTLKSLAEHLIKKGEY